MTRNSVSSTSARSAALLMAAAVIACVPSAAQQSAAVTPSGTLQMYFVDVEGGQSTLIVTPSGQSLLIDAGFPGHAGRVAQAARDAGLSRIDYLVVTHFHADHFGGVSELAQLMPIGTFIDHNDLRQPGAAPAFMESFAAYARARSTAVRLIARPGDRLPLNDIDGVVVSSDRATITEALPGAGSKNAACTSAHLPAEESLENPRSTGIRFDFGRFRFIDLGDLAGEPLFALFCPTDLLGPADVYVLPHHGGGDAAHPATFGSQPPRVIVLNNGSRKGGHPTTFAALHRSPDIDTWQLHRSINEGAKNFPDDRIANLDETTTFWITISAKADGSFVVTNRRTGEMKSYGSR
jgi:beta-lactamase superfamily II metal-dependent hydrolase